MEIHETPLPGVGTRYDFTTRDGRQVAVITHNNGRRDIAVYGKDDPDAARELISLATDEADELGGLLTTAHIAGPLNDLQQRIEGLAIDWLRLPGNSAYARRPMGDTQARSRTGASIVAVVRSEQAYPAIRPDFILEAEDVLVVVGTPAGVAALREILAS